MGTPRQPASDSTTTWWTIVAIVGVGSFFLGRACSRRETVFEPSVVGQVRSSASERRALQPSVTSADAHSYEVPIANEPTKAPTPLSATLVPEVTPKPVSAQPDLVIEDFLVREPDSIGAIWFDGEVHNLGSGSPNVRIIVKAYSINGVLLDSKEIHVSMSPIPPGGSAHFHSYVKSTGADEIRKVVPRIVAY